MDLGAFRALISAVLSLFVEITWKLVIFGAFMALLGLIGLPYVNRTIRLLNLGKTTPVTVSSGRTITIAVPNVGGSVSWKAYIEGRSEEFLADKEYKKGDHAYLTYSDRIGFGVITEKSNSTFEVFFADTFSIYAVGYALIPIVLLTITNIGLIVLAAVEHTIAPDVLNDIKTKPYRILRVVALGTALLEALLAVTLCLVPIAATLAAFSISLKIQQANLTTIYIIYVALMLFFFSHITAGAAIGLLNFFRSAFGRGLRAIIAYIASLAASLNVLIKIVRLTFSGSVVDLSSWWDVAKQFGHSVF
jgi:hypothetical protein